MSANGGELPTALHAPPAPTIDETANLDWSSLARE